jgi:hypothetical protein
MVQQLRVSTGDYVENPVGLEQPFPITMIGSQNLLCYGIFQLFFNSPAVAYSGESLNSLDNFVNTKKILYTFASNSKPYIE